MKKERLIFSINSVLGIILILLGVSVFKSSDQGTIRKLCLAIGSVCTAFGIGSLIQELIVSTVECDEIKKKKDIEVKDERNTQIREKSAYRVSYIMNYLLSSYTIFLAGMKAKLIFIIPAVALIVIQLILLIYYSNYYSKTM
ncbi:MAG: DUF2178 domain-containing protein [Clostridium botulinum]|nr:DUF2178 domain-containing protein [Clostridium botulinum]